jgi:CDP-glycerol glycerophosphotransferase (TagB/SpsB family)
VLVQEGMTDPKNFAFYLVKWFKFPRYLASTASSGMSDAYDIFCVASDGYKEMFVHNGIREDKIRVTGIPNFDNCEQYYKNNFPYKNFILVATSDSRETFKYENRKKFIDYSLMIADGRMLIFKLHPNENHEKAKAEISRYAPGALVYDSGNIHEMIANCDVLITRYSTVVYTGIALGKEVYSYFDIEELNRMTPIQNNGFSAYNIAEECKLLMKSEDIQPIFKEKMKKTNSIKKSIRNYMNLLMGAI